MSGTTKVYNATNPATGSTIISKSFANTQEESIYKTGIEEEKTTVLEEEKDKELDLGGLLDLIQDKYDFVGNLL